jgi:hypothetical protein
MTKNNLSWRRNVAALLLAGLLSAAHAGNRDADVDKYLDIFANETQASQKDACKALSWEGLSDPRLFDEIEKKLLEANQATSGHRNFDYAAWLAKALSYSGQPKYKASLQEVALNGHDSTLRRYARDAIEDLAHYAQWNPVIADESQLRADKSPEVNRFANMLRSGDKDLQEIAARHIIEQPLNDDLLFDLLQQQVTPYLATDWHDDDAKAVAYMLKALAASGQEKYLSTVREASVSAKSSTVQKYAKGYLKRAG